jgi:hypothetical protein
MKKLGYEEKCSRKSIFTDSRMYGSSKHMQSQASAWTARWDSTFEQMNLAYKHMGHGSF